MFDRDLSTAPGGPNPASGPEIGEAEILGISLMPAIIKVGAIPDANPHRAPGAFFLKGRLSLQQTHPKIAGGTTFE